MPIIRGPVTRREFLGQGFITGSVALAGASAFSLFADPRKAYATLSPDIAQLKLPVSQGGLCDIKLGAGMIPFICFDLAGGANIAGSNVLVGQKGGQLDFLSTAGYSKLGIPGNMTPNSSMGAGSFVDRQLGLAFHSDSAFLRGILERTAVTTRAKVNGTVIPALSQNDTANNPHNPMYGIYSTGSRGDLLTLIGTDSSDSGGNSMAPSYMMVDTARPTKGGSGLGRDRPGRYRQAGRTAVARATRLWCSSRWSASARRSSIRPQCSACPPRTRS